METGEGDTGDDVDRDVNHHGVPDPVAHGHTHPIPHGVPAPSPTPTPTATATSTSSGTSRSARACEFSESGEPVIKGNIGAGGERIYHVPGSPYYARTEIDESKGERWFCTVADAVEAGWRPPDTPGAVPDRTMTPVAQPPSPVPTTPPLPVMASPTPEPSRSPSPTARLPFSARLPP